MITNPNLHNHHSHLHHTSLDVILFQAFRTQICFIVFTWNSSKFSSRQCVRLKLHRAHRSHVFFYTLDIDDTITKSHGYAVETLLILAVLISPIRVSFPHRFLRHCLEEKTVQTHSGSSEFTSEFVLFITVLFRFSATLP